jgi:hypothetical protein
MKRLSSLVASVWVAAVFAMVAAVAPAQNTTIGIAPTYDGGGDAFSVTVAQHLTLFIYQDLLETKNLFPILLSPGGVYTPLDTSWLTDYVHERSDIDFLLVPTLKPIVSPEHGKWTLLIDLVLLDARTGDQRAAWNVSTEIKGCKTTLDAGGATRTPTCFFSLDNGNHPNSRLFEKQPLGKATASLADSIRDSIPSHIAGFNSPNPAVSAAGIADYAPCPTHVRITYGYKHAASHSYTLFVNGEDQSTSLQEGVSSFKLPPGPMVLQFAIQDAPYKMVKEPLYQLSTVHSCGSSTLVVDLGPSGDAHPHWE